MFRRNSRTRSVSRCVRGSSGFADGLPGPTLRVARFVVAGATTGLHRPLSWQSPEDVMLTLAQGKPVYIARAFGGAAADVGSLLGLAHPRQSEERHRLCKRKPKDVEPSVHTIAEKLRPGPWTDLPYTAEGLIPFLKAHARGVPKWPSNALTFEENRRLFASDDPDEVADLVLTGLRRLFTKADPADRRAIAERRRRASIQAAVPMSEKEFQVAFSAVDDCRRIIAAGKTQRWDVVKWGVTVNLALAAAAAAIAPSVIEVILLCVLAGLVSVASRCLVLHYNRRMTGARDELVKIEEWMKRNGVDYETILGSSAAQDYSAGANYDRQELRIFAWILGLLPFLSLLALLKM